MAAEADRTALQENRAGFNQQQYDILKRCSENRNIAEWNNYRTRQPDAAIELQNADLRGANLEGAQLGGGNLRGARFDGADLLAADFRGADLRNAGFEITVEKAESGKPTRYRIISGPPPAEGDAQSAAAPEETVDAG